jgi:hypothetical protein
LNISVPAVAAQGARVTVADARPILFVHTPKCAGTSVVSMFTNAVGEARASRLYLTTLEATNRDVAGALEDPNIAFISGHIPYFFFNEHAEKFRLFTMLRDPVARVASLFRFLRRQPDLEQRGLRENFTFEEFMASPSGAIFPGIDNAMCRMLSRNPRFHAEEAPELWTLETHAHILDEALATLRDHVFGLAERMAESCALVRHEFGVPFALNAAALNVSSGESFEAARFAAQIRARNLLDLALYERARAMFDERLAAMARLPRAAPADAANMLFQPALDVAVDCRNIAGRQGFHDYDQGFSWIVAHEAARLHFLAPAPACHLMLVLYCLSPDYPVERILLRVNGQAIGCTVVRGAAQWVELHSETLTLDDGVNVLTITPPCVLKVRDILPQNNDDRHLSVALASILFSRDSRVEIPSPPAEVTSLAAVRAQRVDKAERRTLFRRILRKAF